MTMMMNASSFAVAQAASSSYSKKMIRSSVSRNLVVVRRNWLSTMPLDDLWEDHDNNNEDRTTTTGGGGGGGGSSSNTTTRRRPIYVSATRQHVGKTSTSLALLSGLQKRFDRVGYVKPVGQQCVEVCESYSTDPFQQPIKVDKDAALIKKHFDLSHIDYRDTSPVVIPQGYTKDYLDGKITSEQQRNQIMESYQRVENASDVVLCEGTGHCAVGSIVSACNAQVANWLDAKMVLVANGGLGASFDELELNRVLCDKYGVDIAGVIINKVNPSKLDQTQEYLQKAFDSRWGDVPLLGYIPDRPFLGCPALADLERLFEGSALISGNEHRLRHYHVECVKLVATSLNVFLRDMRKNPARTLYVCHASRNDILLGFLMEAQQQQPRGVDWQAGLVVTGCEEYPISTQVLEIVTSLRHSSPPPILLCPQTTPRVMSDIYSYTPKLNSDDEHRVTQTVEHYEPYINFDLLLDRVGYNNHSNHTNNTTAAPDDKTATA